MKKILFGLMLLVSSTTFSQLDSVSVNLNFISIPSIDEDSLIIQQPIFQVEVQLNDFNDFGIIVIKLFQESSNEPLSIFYSSKSDILANGLLSDGKVLVRFPGIDPNLPYQVSIDIQNASLAYLPHTITYYQPN